MWSGKAQSLEKLRESRYTLKESACYVAEAKILKWSCWVSTYPKQSLAHEMFSADIYVDILTSYNIKEKSKSLNISKLLVCLQLHVKVSVGYPHT